MKCHFLTFYDSINIDRQEDNISSESLCEEISFVLQNISREDTVLPMDFFLPDISLEDIMVPWFRKTSAASTGSTWYSLSISFLIHSLTVLLFVFFGKSQLFVQQMKPDLPQMIEVQLVTLSPEKSEEVGSGAGGGIPESHEEQAPVKASTPAEPAPVYETQELEKVTTPVQPVPVHAEVHKAAPVVRKKPERVSVVPPKKILEPVPPVEQETPVESIPQSAPAAPGAPAVQQEGGSGQGTVASTGKGTGTDSGSADRPPGPGRNGQGGSGTVERTFGGPDGPQFMHRVMPAYPHLAKRLEKEGTVLLNVTIDEQGHPVAVEIVKEGGFGFDEEAVKAVKDSTFSPARRDGAPVACKVYLPIRFVLTGAGRG